MLDMDAESRILDILGNRNRRRIIQLLRQKPCFVTEISERLMLSPKAVIEHLQMMEEERILICNLDERRRKYYYLANDLEVQVRFQKSLLARLDREVDPQSHLWGSIALLRKMVESRDRLLANLEALEHDIEEKAEEVLARSREAFEREEDAEIVFALAHYDLTLEELAEYTGLDPSRLGSRLRVLLQKGIVDEMEKGYTLKGIYAS